MEDQPVLQTERLTLRAFALDDANVIIPLVSEKEIAATTLSIPHPYPADEAAKWISKTIEKYQEGVAAAFAIILKETGKIVGSFSIWIKHKHAHAELGYWIAKPYWNNGYATEAGHAILKYGFNDRNLNRIHAHHMTKNPQSGKVMQKMGMAYEGTLRQHVLKDGEYQDLAIYAITKDQYNP